MSNTMRALEMATGLAANGRIDPTEVISTAGEYLTFLNSEEGSSPPRAGGNA